MYTLEDLEKAKKEVEFWGEKFANNSSNNPDKFFAERRNAQRHYRVVETALKKNGLLPLTEKEELKRRLDAAFPNANHKDIVLFEGKRYQCRFFPLEQSRSRKSVKVWEHSWTDLETHEAFQARQKPSESIFLRKNTSE